MKLSVIDYGHNSDLPASVTSLIQDEDAQSKFRAVLNSALGSGKSEMNAFLSAWKTMQDLGYEASESGPWVKKDAPTTDDVHVPGPIGGKKPKRKDDPDADPADVEEFEEAGARLAKFYLPPVEVIAAAKRAADIPIMNVEGITDALANGTGLELAGVRKVAAEYFAKTAWPDRIAENAWGGPLAEKWANRVIRKAGNGVMLAFWPSPDLAERLAINGGESAKDLHVTLAYFGQLEEVGVEKLPAIERAVQAFAATHGPVQATLGGVGRFPASPSSDDKDVAYLAVAADGLQQFRADLVAAVETAGAEPRKNFAWNPHMTLKYLPPSAQQPKAPEASPVSVTFGFIRLSIGNAAKDYPLTGVSKSLQYEEIELYAPISKIDEHARQVFGWASIVSVNGIPVTDTQGDQITEDTIESAAYDFVLNARVAGEMHQDGRDGSIAQVGSLIESVVYTPQKVANMLQSLKVQNIDAVMQMPFCGWWIGFQISDESVWQKVVSGELKAFSIGGRGKRDKVA